MNGSIVKIRSSSRRREDTMMTTYSSKLDIPPLISMDWNLHIKYGSFQIRKIEK